MCHLAATIPDAYFALRPGAVCTALQQCAKLPATCPAFRVKSTLAPTTNITDTRLDLCTAEGLASGAQLPRVLTGEAGHTWHLTASGTCPQGCPCSLHGDSVTKPAVPRCLLLQAPSQLDGALLMLIAAAPTCSATSTTQPPRPTSTRAPAAATQPSSTASALPSHLC